MLTKLSRLAFLQARPRRASASRLTFESLEDRCVLSTIAGPVRSSHTDPSATPRTGTTPGDYGGDGRADLAVYRPATGQWIVRLPDGGATITQFGDPSQGDIPVPGNYEGNGKNDLAVFRPGTGQWIIRLANGSTTVRTFPGFLPGDLPVPGDYQGVGKTDLAVYRPGTGQWFVQKSSGVTAGFAFGDPTQDDIPVPGDYQGTGKLNFAVFRPATDRWFVRLADGTITTRQMGNPSDGDIPAPGDYEGIGKTDLAVYRPATGQWIIRLANGGSLTRQFGDPARGDVPAGPAQTVVVAPQPYNLYATPDEWTSLHTEFTTRAAVGDTPVVFLGDSITFLWSDAGATPATSQIRNRFIPPRGTDAWNSTFAPLGAVNYGIMGDTTHALLWRVLNGELAGHPEVAVVMIGINDLSRGTTPRATAAGISAVVQAIRSTSPGTKVLLLGLLAPSALPATNALVVAVQQTNALVAQWAASHGVPFADFGGLLAGDVDNLKHPSTQGYDVLAGAIQGPLTALLADPATTASPSGLPAGQRGT